MEGSVSSSLSKSGKPLGLSKRPYLTRSENEKTQGICHYFCLRRKCQKPRNDTVSWAKRSPSSKNLWFSTFCAGIALFVPVFTDYRAAKASVFSVFFRKKGKIAWDLRQEAADSNLSPFSSKNDRFFSILASSKHRFCAPRPDLQKNACNS